MKNTNPDSDLIEQSEKLNDYLIPLNARVKELMEKNGMDTEDSLLVLKISTIYAQAQLDSLRGDARSFIL